MKRHSLPQLTSAARARHTDPKISFPDLDITYGSKAEMASIEELLLSFLVPFRY